MADPTERLATRITPTADRRLRTLAVLEGKSISHVLSAVLEQALPSADELADRLRNQEAVPA